MNIDDAIQTTAQAERAHEVKTGRIASEPVANELTDALAAKDAADEVARPRKDVERKYFTAYHGMKHPASDALTDAELTALGPRATDRIQAARERRARRNARRAP